MNWKFWKREENKIEVETSKPVAGKHITESQKKALKECFKNGMSANLAHIMTGISYQTCAKYYREWRK